MAGWRVGAFIDDKEIQMKMIQAGIALLGLALLAGCETRIDDGGRGGTYGDGRYERGYGNGPYYDSRDGWDDRQGYWHPYRQYRRY